MKGIGSKRHILQAVELSQTAVQIVANPPAPSNGGPIYVFLGKPAMRTRWMAGAAPHQRLQDQRFQRQPVDGCRTALEADNQLQAVEVSSQRQG